MRPAQTRVGRQHLGAGVQRLLQRSARARVGRGPGRRRAQVGGIPGHALLGWHEAVGTARSLGIAAPGLELVLQHAQRALDRFLPCRFPGRIGPGGAGCRGIARHASRGGWRVFEEPMTARGSRRAQLAQRLRGELAGDSPRLVSQPQVELRGHRITRLEALLRWQDEELGQVSPVELIRLAEETGTIHAGGERVLD
ncbi:MAG: EAL domain-containing protein, partial [bacterium]